MKLECMQRNAALLLLSSVRFLTMLCRKWANNWIKKRSLSIESSVWLLGFQPHWLDLIGIFSYYQPLYPLIIHFHVHNSVRFEISSSHWQKKVLSMNLGEMRLIWITDMRAKCSGTKKNEQWIVHNNRDIPN